MLKSASLLILLLAASGTAVWIGSDRGMASDPLEAAAFTGRIAALGTALEPGRLDEPLEQGLVRETLELEMPRKDGHSAFARTEHSHAESIEDPVLEIHGMTCSSCDGREPGEGIPTYLGTRGTLPRQLRKATDGERGLLLALDWIAESVKDKSAWHERDVRSSSMALVALIGGGNTLSSGGHKNLVRDGIHALKTAQRRDEPTLGFFLKPEGSHAMRAQIMATLAMSESFWCSNQTPVLKRPMRYAVTSITAAANFQSGWGTDIAPGSPPDLRTTSLALLALDHAHTNHLRVNPEILHGGRTWLDLRWMQALEDGIDGPRLEAIAAASLFHTMLAAGQGSYGSWEQHPQYTRMLDQVELLKQAHQRWRRVPSSIDLWTWVLATEAMHQWGGPAWTDWNRATEKAFLGLQRASDPKDPYRGSWKPRGLWRLEGDRLYTTSMIAYLLETPYRRGPLLRR